MRSLGAILFLVGCARAVPAQAPVTLLPGESVTIHAALVPPDTVTLPPDTVTVHDSLPVVHDTLPVVHDTVCPPSTPLTLRQLGTARRLSMGAAGSIWVIYADSQYRRVLAEQYNTLVPENAMKFQPLHPSQATYSFTDADSLVGFASANGMTIHGHVLVWHNSLPAWVTGGTWTKATLLAVLKDHITTVVTHWKGKLASWDVVNEALMSDGKFRATIWYTKIGPEYIDSAFVWAHRADPAAKLYLNEDGSESTIWVKADSVLALAQRLKARGVPIDGVGFQTHFPHYGGVTPTAVSVKNNLSRFVAAGFDVQISEMDVMVANGASLTPEAITYRDMLDVCLSLPRCVGFTTWGFTDKYSWIPAAAPGYGRGLPLDSLYQKKPAYDSLVARLRRIP